MISFDDQMANLLAELEAFEMPSAADPAEVHIARNYDLACLWYRAAPEFRGVKNG